MAGDLVGYFEVRAGKTDREGSQGTIDVFGNEQFYLGRDATLCRYAWPDSTISKQHLRIHCILYEKDAIANISPFVYATDLSTNGTYLKKINVECSGSKSERGVLMGRKNGSFLLDDGDELYLSESVTLIYHELDPAEEYQLTPNQRQDKQLFASRYFITGRLIGAGGCGKVLVGIRQRDQRQLACKIINLRLLYKNLAPPNLRVPAIDCVRKGAHGRWPSRITRCFREFDILKDLNHPNIIHIEKVFWNSNTIYLFEELVTGGDLFSYIEYKGNRLQDVEAAVIIRQVLKGVEYLHDHDIVHRDLKPDNILLTSLENGARIVITDFGNARFMPEDHATTALRPGLRKRMFSVVGTLEYVAPEVHKANKAIPREQGYSKAIDMWSVGAVTVTLLAGDCIFTNRNDPRYEQDPAAVIIELSSRCDISVIDNERHPVWRGVGCVPKDFIRRLLLLEEQARMTATEALAHPWFSDRRYAAEFEALYHRSVKDWQPRRKVFRLVESIRGLSSAGTSATSERLPGNVDVSHCFPLHPVSSNYIPRTEPSFEDYSAAPVLSPIAEEHEETEYEVPSCYEQRSCDRAMGPSDTERLPPMSQQPGSVTNPMKQPCIDSDPPASGMYSAYEAAHDSYEYDEGMNEAMNEVSRRIEESDPDSQLPVPDTDSGFGVIPETPIEYSEDPAGLSAEGSPLPMPPTFGAVSETQGSFQISRPPVPETQEESTLGELSVQDAWINLRGLNSVLPSYSRVFGESAAQYGPQYTDGDYPKRRKLTYDCN